MIDGGEKSVPAACPIINNSLKSISNPISINLN